MTAYRENDPLQDVRAKHTKLEERVHVLEVRASGEERRFAGRVLSGEFWRKLGIYVILPLSVAIGLGPAISWTCTPSQPDLRAMRARTQSCQRACTAIGARGVDARMVTHMENGGCGYRALRCVCVGPGAKLRAFDEDFTRLVELPKEHE